MRCNKREILLCVVIDMYELLSKYNREFSKYDLLHIKEKIKSMHERDVRFNVHFYPHGYILPVSKFYTIFTNFSGISDACDRKLILTECKDCYHVTGTRIISLAGSPVRAWAVLDEQGGVIVYCRHDRKTKIYNNTVVINDIWDDYKPGRTW